MVPAELMHVAWRWRLGQTLTVHQAFVVPKEGALIDGPAMSTVRIVGAYRPRNFLEPYWFGLPYFASLRGPAVASAGRPLADAVLLGEGAFGVRPPTYTPAVGLPYVPRIAVEIDVDVPLVAQHVRLADLTRLRRDVAAVQRRFPRQTARPAYPAMRTGLGQALVDADRDRGQVRTATLVVVLELAALSLLVLFQVVGGAVDARGDEIALAKLRGLPPRRTVVFALAEPVALLLAAAPLGFAVAFVVTRTLTGSALVAGTPVSVTAATGWALAAAFAGSALAAGLAAVRTLTRPVLEQWRSTSRPVHGRRWVLALELGLAAAAITTVVLLRTQDAAQPGTIYLLAPTLLVFAAALVGMRLLPRIGRRGLPRTRAGRHVAVFLALRQTVRRTGGLRLATLLAVAAGLATFAVCGEAVARANRDARAQTELGAPRRLTVQFETAHDPERVVAAADPRRQWAMASATWSPDGGPPGESTITGQVLALQPDRLAATMYRVRGQLAPSRLARLVHVPGAGAITFRGTRLRVTLSTSALHGDHPTVELGIRKGTAPALRAPTAPLRPGTADYVATVACATGCAFTGITFDTSVDAQDTVTGAITVRGLAVDSGTGFVPFPVPLNRAAAWRSDEIGYGAQLHITSTGPEALALQLRTTGASSAILTYAEFPASTPVVAAPLCDLDAGRTRGRARLLGRRDPLRGHPPGRSAAGRAGHRRGGRPRRPAHPPAQVRPRVVLVGVAGPAGPGRRGGPPDAGRAARAERADRGGPRGRAEPAGAGPRPAAAPGLCHCGRRARGRRDRGVVAGRRAAALVRARGAARGRRAPAHAAAQCGGRAGPAAQRGGGPRPAQRLRRGRAGAAARARVLGSDDGRSALPALDPDRAGLRGGVRPAAVDHRAGGRARAGPRGRSGALARGAAVRAAGA